MILEFSFCDEDYYDLNSLIKSINEFAGFQDYAVVKKRIKFFKKGVFRKAVLMCDRDDKYENKDHDKRQDFIIIKIECEFEVIAFKASNDMGYLIVKEFSHNHENIMTISHSMLRKSFMTSQIQKIIETQNNFNVVFQKIITDFRVDDDDENLRFLTKNIYNMKTTIRRKNLKSLISTQILLRNLNRDDGFCKHKINEYHQIGLFTFSFSLINACNLTQIFFLQ